MEAALWFFPHKHDISFTAVLSVVLMGLRAEDWSRRSLQKNTISAAWVATLQLFIGIYGFASLFILPVFIQSFISMKSGDACMAVLDGVR